jgi:aspartyl-tRNA(Asn)/glutamyl-tRNA(Gln) amidotransferase subunit A
MSAPLWSLGLIGTNRAYRDGRTTPNAVLDAIIDRIATVEPVVNAFAYLDLDGARAAAAASTARWQAGAPLGPMDGVVLSIKDNITVAGLPCAWGSALFRDFVPETDELPVRRLREQGAVLLGKTNVSEFTLGRGTVHTALFGTTRNPWDPAKTTGASSGGAAAAVASGMGSAALGTDGGGSIRRPASHCGLVGLKPGTGRVPRRDGLPVILHDCEVIGPLARSVADVAALYRAIAEPDETDRLSWPYAGRAPEAQRTARLRIRYVARFGDHPVDPPVSARCAEVAERLAALGHIVEAGDAPFDIKLHEHYWPVISAAGMAWLLRDREWQGHISEFHAALVERGQRLSAGDYIDALTAFRTLAGQLGAFFSSHDLLLTPAAGALPWTAEETGPPHERAFTGFVNAAGVPALVLPGEPVNGLPVGFQLVAPFGHEETLLSVGAAYEAAYPWAGRWPECGHDIGRGVIVGRTV